jgi:multiple sugar transport system ATP-binding protein
MSRALVREPALLLFDEPLSNLNEKLRVKMRAEIKRLHLTTNASVVYVTHDQIEAMTLATRIVALKDGIVQQVGTPDEICNRPANTFVADFMGVPR